MDGVAKAHLWLLNACKAGSGLIIFAVFVVIVADVGLTILAGWGLPVLPWDRTHGLVEYGLLWFTMLAAPWLVRIKGHVFVDALTQLLPPTVKLWTARFAYLVAISGCLAFVYFSVQLWYEAFVFQELDDRGAYFPLWTLYFPMPFGFSLMAVEFFRYLIGVDDMYGSRMDVREGV